MCVLSPSPRYRDYRYPPGHEREYKHTMHFWHILAAKMAFIIIMEVRSHTHTHTPPNTDLTRAALLQHVVFMAKFFVVWLIPDVPSDVKARIKRERYLVQEHLHAYEVERMKMQLSASFVTEPQSEMSSMTDRILSECL